MPRQPKYRLHKSTGQALVEIDGRRHYLGKYDSPVSWEKYHRLLAEHAAGGIVPRPSEQAAPRTVGELALAFYRHAQARYVKDGKQTSEVKNFRLTLRPMRELYASLAVNEFGPLCLLACRHKFIEKGYCRKQVNKRINQVRQVFKWGVSRQIVKPETWLALRSVDGLRAGEAAFDLPDVEPAPMFAVEAVEPFVTPQLWAMIRFQILTGCRPGEACVLRACDIDMSDDVWVYRPHRHKLQHKNKVRAVCVGPKAQEILRPWLEAAGDAYLFTPRQGREQYLASIRRRPGQPALKRQFQPCYTTSVYGASVRRACKAAGVPHWHPNQLRHGTATKINSEEQSIETVRVVLGHSSAVTSEIYAKRDLKAAKELMRRVG